MFFNKTALNSIADVDSAAIRLSLIWDELFPPAPKFDGKKKNILREMVCKLAGYDGGYQQFLAHLHAFDEDQHKVIIQSKSLMMASFSDEYLYHPELDPLPLDVSGIGKIYLYSLTSHFKELVDNKQQALIHLDGIPIYVVPTDSGYSIKACKANTVFKLESFERIVFRAAGLGLNVADFLRTNLISLEFIQHLISGNVYDSSMLMDLAIKLKVSTSWIVS